MARLQLDDAYRAIEAGKRLSESQALTLLRGADLLTLGRLARQRMQHIHSRNTVTFLIDRNINYTNVCESRCRFCAFFREPDHPEAYLLSRNDILCKVAEAARLGATQIMLQGGLNPAVTLDYIEDILKSIKQDYDVSLHCFSPPEIRHFARLSGKTIADTLRRLYAAGLDSLPGGGAEILSDRVRALISPRKISSRQWLAVMKTAHRIGLKTTATMMMGSVETLRERIGHLKKIRHLQDLTGGFRAFIPWTFTGRNTDLGDRPVSSIDYLKTLAVARLYLDSIPNIQGSWVTQGKDIGQVSLFFGANDLGSIMLEENVVRAAGVTHRITEKEMVHLIQQAGCRAAQRDTRYRVIKTYARAAMPSPASTGL